MNLFVCLNGGLSCNAISANPMAKEERITTIYKVFGMNRPGIKPWSPAPEPARQTTTTRRSEQQYDLYEHSQRYPIYLLYGENDEFMSLQSINLHFL